MKTILQFLPLALAVLLFGCAAPVAKPPTSVDWPPYDGWNTNANWSPITNSIAQ